MAAPMLATMQVCRAKDPIGSFLVPVVMFMSTGFMFGWAKPVPYNPYNLRDQRWGTALVAVAGVVSNLILAIIFGLLIRFSSELGIPSSFVSVANIIVILNLVLAIFNLIPLPPLDGSKVLFSLLPYRYSYIQEAMERNALIIMGVLIFLIFTGVISIWPILSSLFSLITGTPISF